MEQDLYKNITVTRGLNYHYYFSPARDSKPTLVFLHGFPSTSYDWRHQAVFFRSHGFGVIVPDMLGYGGTAKPDSPSDYVPSLIVRDIVDILDKEGIDKVISIGHDWGAMINSRFVNYFPDRIIALALFNLGYIPPLFTADFAKLSEATKAVVGYETFGYWNWFNEDDADKTIESHLDSFISLGFSGDPTLRKTVFAHAGAAKAWVLADKMGPPNTYMTEEEKRTQKDLLLKGGFKGPTNWYKVAMRGYQAEDDKLIPQDRYVVHQPVFFGGCRQDYLCLPELAKGALDAFVKNLTYREFDGGHWTVISHPKEVNTELLGWIETL